MDCIPLLLECFALLVQSLVQSFLGRELDDAEVDFEYEQPHYHALYSKYLHGKVRFAQAETCVRIPTELALASNASGDTRSFSVAIELCQELLAQLPATRH